MGVALGKDGTASLAGVTVEVSVCLATPLPPSSCCFSHVGIYTSCWADQSPFRQWGLPSQALISGGFREVGAAWVLTIPLPHFLFLASQSPDVSFTGGNTNALSLRVLGSNSIFVTEGVFKGA